MRMQLVAARQDTGRPVDAIGADGFELPDHRAAIGRDRRPDPRDHRVIARQTLAVVMHFGRHGVDRHVAAGGVDHFDCVAAGFADFDQTRCGIVAGFTA